ncbi:30S ribosomal protein S2 [Candidatus Saccharibacteria bacterium]|nr:30S ribosomal protein S2 [Candidatus Saccharibacteria bacterium]
MAEAKTEVNIKDLLEAGAHFGHRTSRWHPKMAPYIHSQRQGIYIINLEKTVEALDKALAKVESTVASGGKVLFVGTKKQASPIVKAMAEAVEMPYVSGRWIGGVLTNSETMTKQLKKLADLERKMESGELEKRYNKLEVQRFQEEIDMLNQRYGGVKNLSGKPALMVVMGAFDDQNALREARKLNIPTIAVVDTNVDPTEIDIAVPANDDAIKSLQLLADYFVAAVVAGKKKIGA